MDVQQLLASARDHDVLIASRVISTGINQLQEHFSALLVNELPETYAEWAQLVGADPVQTKDDPNLTKQEINITTGGRENGPQIRAERILQVGRSAKGLINDLDSAARALQLISNPDGATVWIILAFVACVILVPAV